MNRDITIIAKEIDWIEFFNEMNIYNIKIDLNVKIWDDFVLKIFPKLNFFDPKFLEGKDITSLKGCPKEFFATFNCRNNKLTSLEGAPEKINGSFNCSDNRLTSLEGAPKEVRGGFFLSV